MLLSRSRLAYECQASGRHACYSKHNLASKNICKAIVNNHLRDDPFVSRLLESVFCCNDDLDKASRLSNSICAPAASPPED